MAVASNGLLAATNRGLFLVSERGTQQLTPFYSLCVYVSKINPSVVFVGQQNGLGMLNLAGGGRNFRLVGKTNEQIVGITEDEKGNLWLETLSDGVIKINVQTNEEKNTPPKMVCRPYRTIVSPTLPKDLLPTIKRGFFVFNPKKTNSNHLIFSKPIVPQLYIGMEKFWKSEVEKYGLPVATKN